MLAIQCEWMADVIQTLLTFKIFERDMMISPNNGKNEPLDQILINYDELIILERIQQNLPCNDIEWIIAVCPEYKMLMS